MTRFINRIKKIFKLKPRCSHEFKGREIQHRNSEGIVKWACHKCGKEFQAKCGLDIVARHGKCIGEWL